MDAHLARALGSDDGASSLRSHRRRRRLRPPASSVLAE